MSNRRSISPDRLEELLRDDGVGIDVGAVERGHQAFVTDEFFHDLRVEREERP
jgi:hypothetical protein